MKKLFIIAILLLCALEAQADTHISATCSQTDVQSAISAAVDGDTVSLPSNTTCTWSSAVSFGNKNITLMSNGTTTLIDGLASHPFNTAMITIASQNKYFRITGLNLVQGANASGYGLIFSSGTTTQFRIDHNTFKDASPGCSRFFWITGVYGLIDHNTLNVTQCSAGVQGITTNGNGDSDWLKPLTLGTTNAIYIENNTFNFSHLNDGAMDSYSGSRVVFRNNTVIGTNLGWHGYDSGGHRSPHSYEIYNNVFTSPSYSIFVGLNNRGGTGVVYSNTWDANYQADMYLSYYRSCCDSAYYESIGINNPSAYCSSNVYNPILTGYVTDATTTPHGYGRCNGTNPLDQNGDATGYPCKDQIGFSTIDTSGTEYSMPLYQWLNTRGGSAASFINNTSNVFGCSSPSMSDHVKVNRDYYNYTAAFDGTVGTGSGLLSSRPATCTTGVGYWATDQNKLYKCTATNTWTAYYQPFTYPYPLTVESTGLSGASRGVQMRGVNQH